MKLYTNTLALARRIIAALVTFYHRVIGCTQQEYLSLHERLNEIEASSVAEIAQIKADILAKEQYIFALESCLTSDLCKQLEAIKWLHATKREAVNVQGSKPEVLR